MVGRVHFRSLSHFRGEIRAWRGEYNGSRLHGGIGWKTPSEVNFDRKVQRRVAYRGAERGQMSCQLTGPDLLSPHT
ncbi:MAG: integrase core domain-containing protein [Thermoplasmata archaeon]